jgi:hypothetical protein
MGGFVKYAIEIGSGVMIYIPSFIKIGLGIQKLIGGRGDSHRGDRVKPIVKFMV